MAPPGEQAASMSKKPVLGAAGTLVRRTSKLTDTKITVNPPDGSSSSGGGGSDGVGGGGNESETGNRRLATVPGSNGSLFDRAGCSAVTTVTKLGTVEVDGHEVRPTIR